MQLLDELNRALLEHQQVLLHVLLQWRCYWMSGTACYRAMALLRDVRYPYPVPVSRIFMQRPDPTEVVPYPIQEFPVALC
eukprot:1838273-Rhodomonas_salina.1